MRKMNLQTPIRFSVMLPAVCLLLTGCGGKGTFEGSVISDETGFRIEYSILDREESAELTLEKEMLYNG